MRAVLDEQVDAAELRGMLRLRRAQLAEAIAADEQRLTRVEARLRTIESEGTMSAHDVVLKRVPSVRVAELTAVAASYQPEDIGPVIGPLFAELCRRLAEAGIAEAGPSVARYEDVPEGEGTVLIRVAVPVGPAVEPGRYGFAVLDLPPIEEAATVVHRGSMDEAMGSFQELARFIDANGYRSAGYAREALPGVPGRPGAVGHGVPGAGGPPVGPVRPGPTPADPPGAHLPGLRRAGRVRWRRLAASGGGDG